MSSKKTKTIARSKARRPAPKKAKKTSGSAKKAARSARASGARGRKPTRKTKPAKSAPRKAATRTGAAAKKKTLPVQKKDARAAKASPRTTPVRVKTAPAAPAPDQPKAAPAPKARSSRRSRRATLIRRGPDGEILAPGELLLPGGPRANEEVLYLFRGVMAAERPVPEEAVTEVFQKRGQPEQAGEREELLRAIEWARQRFGEGDVDPVIPARTNLRRTFQGVVDRARLRRREIGAFLRGLDMGHTETSHMDAHGEASLQSLMEWAARLENLVENLTENDESNQGHYVQFHRVLDQLESTTEALMIDVEQTLRRLRDRLRS
jgi:hypothetical protein